jgi:hypothetical protein
MSTTQRRYPKDEIARQGDEIFLRDVQPRLNASDDGKFVAIDVETREYVVAEDELAACDQLRAKLPEAQIWLLRVGSSFLHRFGGRDSGSNP